MDVSSAEAALTVVPVFGSTVLHIKMSAASKKTAAVRESFFTFCIVVFLRSSLHYINV